MIRLIHSTSLDVQKYDTCISESQQSLVYAYSWYLDIVCDSWSVLVLDDYMAVMPIPYRKKYFIHYVYPPLWILQLGLFSKDRKIKISEFIVYLNKKFRFIELRLNSENSFIEKVSDLRGMNFQELPLKKEMAEIRKSYQSDRRKDLKKADRYGLVGTWVDDPQPLIELFRRNVGQRTPEIQSRDYLNLEQLINSCIEKKKGELLSIYEKDQLVASAFFLKHQKTVTILCSSTDFSNRNHGANTFLIDLAIQKFKGEFDVFNFGGSSMESIAKYFFSFGAQQRNYPMLLRKFTLF